MSYTAVAATPPQEFTCVAKQPPKPKPLWAPNRRRPLEGLETVEVVGIAGLAATAVLAGLGLVIGLKDS
jgi:hypothetical protein